MMLLNNDIRTFCRSQCARERIRLATEDFYKVNRKASVDGIKVGSIATRHWIRKVEIGFPQ